MARAFSKRVPPCCGVAIGDSGGTRGADTIAARRAGSDPAQRRRRRDGFHPRRGTRQRWGLYRGHNGAELLPGVLGNGGSDLAVMAFRSSTWCPALRHHDSMKYSQKLLVSVLVATLFGALLTVTLSTPVAAGTDVHDGMAPQDGVDKSERPPTEPSPRDGYRALVTDVLPDTDKARVGPRAPVCGTHQHHQFSSGYACNSPYDPEPLVPSKCFLRVFEVLVPVLLIPASPGIWGVVGTVVAIEAGAEKVGKLYRWLQVS